ncbi:MAG: glycosyltransferase family 29 protein [Planktomarina sp.]
MSKLWRKLAAAPGKFLWRAPRGFLLRSTRPNVKIFTAFVEGKSVAIVGNATALLDTNQGQQIDGHDIVIRINKGFVKSPQAQGARTDILTLDPEVTEQEIEDHFNPQMLLFLLAKLRHVRIFRPHNIKKLCFYPYRFWLSDRNKIGRRPSSGYMITSYVLRVEAARSITLYGFDFGATGTFYNPEGYKTPHDFAKEAKIIRSWADEGRITIIPPNHPT